MRSSLLIATCLVALASAAPNSLPWLSLLDSEGDEETIKFVSSAKLEDAWKAFKTNYGKTYPDEKEEMVRKEIFAENLKAVNDNNDLYSKGLTTFTMEINQFADMNDSEFMKLMTGYVTPQDLSVISSLSPDNDSSTLPKRVDWRTKGYVTNVKNQRTCGSCWAFSATGALEGQHFRKTGRLLSLSEQQLVDCSDGNNGCKGGWPGRAFSYVAKNCGIGTEQSYPYVAKDGCCRYNRSNQEATCKSYKQYLNSSEKQLQALVASVGPISVAIDSSQKSFKLYKKGIYYDKKCEKAIGKLNHAVLVVGYGQGKGKKNSYWIIKNSWGKDWGMNGYIWMSRNRGNNCGVATAFSYPVV